MASLQKKGDSWYCQFMFQRQRYTYTIGGVEEAEAKTTAAKIDYILMRIRQRLLELPLGMDIISFIEHDGKPPPDAKPEMKITPFKELRKAYLEVFGNGTLENNTLYTAKIHLNHLAETLGEKFPLNSLSLSHLQRHVDRRRKEVSGVTIKKKIDSFREAWNWAIRMGFTQGTFPNAGLVYPKGDDKLPFMTSEEIKRASRPAATLTNCGSASTSPTPRSTSFSTSSKPARSASGSIPLSSSQPTPASARAR